MRTFSVFLGAIAAVSMSALPAGVIGFGRPGGKDAAAGQSGVRFSKLRAQAVEAERDAAR